MSPLTSAVAAVIEDPAGRLLLCQQSQGHRLWSLPGGKIRPDESPLHAAIRDIREEIGTDVEIVDLVGLYQLTGGQTDAELPDVLIHVFRARLDGEVTLNAPARICRLSGQLASDRCPATDEWFKPGTAPTQHCDWHRADGVHLPVEYEEWKSEDRFRVPRSGFDGSQAFAPEANDLDGADGTPHASDVNAEPGTRNLSVPDAVEFRITSPQSGDRYRIPPGVEARYATLGLRTAGGHGGQVRWQVDGQAIQGSRWSLTAGRHRIRAASGSGETDTIEIEVE